MERLIGFCLLVGLASAPAGADAAMLTQEVCERLAKAERTGDVGYKPGYTADGRRVREADIRQANDRSPLPARVDVSVVLRDNYKVPRRRSLYRGELPVSRFTVREDGVLSYAGQPLAVADQQEISVICRGAWG